MVRLINLILLAERTLHANLFACKKLARIFNRDFALALVVPDSDLFFAGWHSKPKYQPPDLILVGVETRKKSFVLGMMDFSLWFLDATTRGIVQSSI